jgi:hypothetical protein
MLLTSALHYKFGITLLDSLSSTRTHALQSTAAVCTCAYNCLLNNTTTGLTIEDMKANVTVVHRSPGGWVWSAEEKKSFFIQHGWWQLKPDVNLDLIPDDTMDKLLDRIAT